MRRRSRLRIKENRTRSTLDAPSADVACRARQVAGSLVLFISRRTPICVRYEYGTQISR